MAAIPAAEFGRCGDRIVTMVDIGRSLKLAGTRALAVRANDRNQPALSGWEVDEPTRHQVRSECREHRSAVILAAQPAE